MESPKLLSYAYRRYFCLKLEEEPDFETLSFEPEAGIWQEAEFTENFVDIEGENKSSPWFDTRVKIRWSEGGLYFLAIMQGDEVWANVKDRDEVIFQDNDFEIFLDPDDDTHTYIELEINAINTVWDLLLTKPYRIGGLPLNSFDIKGLKTKTCISKNDCGDVLDWRALIFWPFESILEVNGRKKQLPELGDYYRLNFSRVHWNTDQIEDRYIKRKDKDGRVLPEENWVWSEQGLVNMHYPENWGFLYFCDEESLLRVKKESDAYLASDLFKAKSLLWSFWYLVHDYKEKKGYLPTKKQLIGCSIFNERVKWFIDKKDFIVNNLSIESIAESFILSYSGDKFTLMIDKDGLFTLR